MAGSPTFCGCTWSAHYDSGVAPENQGLEQPGLAQWICGTNEVPQWGLVLVK